MLIHRDTNGWMNIFCIEECNVLLNNLLNITDLNDTFSDVKTHVFLMDPPTLINHIHSFVIQEESNRKNLMQIEDNSILVNVAQRLDFNHRKLS